MVSANLVEFARTIEEAQRKRRLEKNSAVWRPRSTTATMIGHKCVRRIVYHRTQPEQAKPISDWLASVFQEGKEHEKMVRRELSELGFEVLEAELSFYDKDLELGGNIDGKLAVNGDRHNRVPAEIKSTEGHHPTTEQELAENESFYGRYYDQLQVYMFLDASEEGLFIFKSRVSGLYDVVPVSLDYGRAETLLRRAEEVRDHVAAGTIPDRTADRTECERCPWRDSVCHPEEHAPDPMLIATDEKLEAELSERELLDEGRKRFAKLDARIKKRFNATPGDRFLCGPFKIEKKPHGKSTRVDIKRVSAKVPEEF